MVPKPECHKLAPVCCTKVQTIRLCFTPKLLSLQFHDSTDGLAHCVPHLVDSVLLLPALLSFTIREVSNV